MDKSSAYFLRSCYGAIVSTVYDASKWYRSFASNYEQDAATGERVRASQKNGVPAGVQQEVRETRATPKPVRTGSMKIPVGRVNEVLKQAKRQDLEQLKAVWGELLGRLKSYNKVAFAVLLENSEPVAASDDTYVLAFQYEIHCKMASENREAMDTVEQALFELLSKRLNMIAIPKVNGVKSVKTFTT